MFNGKKVSVVMPAFNEEESIYAVVKDFSSNKYVDEVIVVDNDSTDRTQERARKAGAEVIIEKRRGYGHACQRALREATGDIIILTESDGTFDSRDLIKFLIYSNEFDLVLGTRTSKELIWEGANMSMFLRWGNLVFGKLIELLYNGPLLTDVGCTYRLINKKVLHKIQKEFTVGNSHFSPEMIIVAIKNKLKIIEIPINYKPRKGSSKITGKKLNTFVLGLNILKLIFSKI